MPERPRYEVGSLRTATNCHVSHRHTRTVWSHEFDAKSLPSLEKVMDRTGRRCPSRMLTCRPSLGFQIRIVLSREQEARRSPVGDQMTAFTSPVWPRSMVSRANVLVLQI